jgi:hypothetical protein
MLDQVELTREVGSVMLGLKKKAAAMPATAQARPDHREPDRVALVQAQNGPERPPRRCVDLDVEFPPGSAVNYPVLTGGYTVRGG